VYTINFQVNVRTRVFGLEDRRHAEATATHSEHTRMRPVVRSTTS